jgi:hypothetical protein
MPAEDVTEALASAPENLIELQVCQLQRLPNDIPRLFTKVMPFQHFAVALHGQSLHELADTFRQLLLAEPLFEGQSLVREIGEQLTIAVMLPRSLLLPVPGREIASRAIEIASQVARIIQSFSADLLDRTSESTLQQVLSRVVSDTPLKE